MDEHDSTEPDLFAYGGITGVLERKPTVAVAPVHRPRRLNQLGLTLIEQAEHEARKYDDVPDLLPSPVEPWTPPPCLEDHQGPTGVYTCQGARAAVMVMAFATRKAAKRECRRQNKEIMRRWNRGLPVPRLVFVEAISDGKWERWCEMVGRECGELVGV